MGDCTFVVGSVFLSSEFFASTHVVVCVQQCCRILFLHEGKVVWEGSTSEFDTSTNAIVRQVIIGVSLLEHFQQFIFLVVSKMLCVEIEKEKPKRHNY